MSVRSIVDKAYRIHEKISQNDPLFKKLSLFHKLPTNGLPYFNIGATDGSIVVRFWFVYCIIYFWTGDKGALNHSFIYIDTNNSGLKIPGPC